jgi:hypothetical protein
MHIYCKCLHNLCLIGKKEEEEEEEEEEAI